MQREKTADRAVGQWRGILAAVGLPARALANKHGPCPMCGGKDRFRFDDKNGRGTWICSQCGAGDGVTLVMQFLGLPFKDAVQRIDAHIGDAVIYTPKGLPAAADDAKRREIQTLWARSQAIELDDLAGRYLLNRTGLSVFPSALRFVADERYVEVGQRPSFHPAMVAKVDPSDDAAAAGERAAIHRTYLSTVGGKADVGSPRKMLGTMPSGAAVRLAPAGDVLGIAEGIETALSASILFNVPCWSALNAGLLEAWTPPAGVSTVFVFGDNDASFTGQAAAYKLAQRLMAKKIDAIVEIPPVTGQDWNDVLMSKLEAA
jgi:putative DNA primase/helicase